MAAATVKQKPKAAQAHQTPDAEVRRWSPLAAIAIAVLLFLLAQIIASLIIAIYPHTQNWTTAHAQAWVAGAYVQFSYIVLAEALTVAGLLWFMRRRKIRLADIGYGGFRLPYVVYALAGFGVYFVAYIALVSLASSAIPDFNVNQQQDVGPSQAIGGGQLLATYISLAVLPPLVEEMLFRGFLFTTFRKRMTLLWAGLLTSALFAVPHLLESASGGLLWIGALDTFTLSVVLCYMREKTGSLWGGVLVHALKNSVAFLSLYLLHVR